MTSEIKKTLQRMSWLVILFVFAGSIISSVEKRSVTRLQDVVVDIVPVDEAHFLITEKDVKKLIEKSFGGNLVGEKMLDIDIERLELALEEEPFVLDAETYFDFQNQIHVKIFQRKPVVRIMDNNGLQYYLDEQGIKMPLSQSYTARVPVVTGSLPPFTDDYLHKKKHLLKDLFELVLYIRADEFLQPLVEQIHVQQGEFMLVPVLGKQKIQLGTLQNLDDKIERLKIFYKEGLPREGWNKYERIDLRFDRQVVAGR